LSLGKETMSKFEMESISGGKATLNYSQCGTGVATIICCATIKKNCTTEYAVCGTGPATMVC
jgi:hypothetical protein